MSSFSFFFFKQKTAYEMRISDWSSDVCSSDLIGRRDLLHELADLEHLGRPGNQLTERVVVPRPQQPAVFLFYLIQMMSPVHDHGEHVGFDGLGVEIVRAQGDRPHRSEEHTYELQSLMRISYAVFCLKKITQ